MTTDDRVRFAVVGCGNIGSRHAAVISQEPRATLAAVCDVDPARVDKLAQQHGVKRYPAIEQLLAEADTDVVCICTPHGLHAEMAIQAANAGRHILVEKPMALTSADADAMVAAAERAGVRLMVVKQNRFNVPIALTQRVLEEGRLGRVYMVQCNVLWNRHEGYYAASNWRGRKALEGGALYTQVSHFIDLLLWWFGDVVEARTTIATNRQAIEIEDCGHSLLKFESGVMGTLAWTTCVYNKNYEGSITIVGEKGTIKIGGAYLNKIEFWDVQSTPLPEDIVFDDKPNAYGAYQGSASNHDKVIGNVVARLLNERAHTVEGNEGIRTIRAIETIYRSAQ